MAMLDRKLFRDIGRIWSQALAIALVMACGVATLILALGTYRALEETRATFYDRYRFADVFSGATRAPLILRTSIEGIDGVSAAELRIVRPALLDMPGMSEPATGLAVSVPDMAEGSVNRLYLRSGRLPHSGHGHEAAVTEAFADAHGLVQGGRFKAILNGRKLEIRVSGVVLSPEYIYQIAPGDMVPDPRRYGIFFMPQKTLSAIFGMQGAFNDLALRIRRDASQPAIIDRLDLLLKPYGGRGAHERDDQISHAFLDNELIQLRAMAFIIPPIFLFVSAFLVNMILSRMITLEREQIGLLKAIGYSNSTIAFHYAKLVALISAVGIAIGFVVGNWLGLGLTALYTQFFSFPFLVFPQNPDLYALSAVVTLAAALAGALNAISGVVSLPAAVAMRAPAPTRYRSLLGAGSRLYRLFSQLTVMALRHLVRWPLRTAMTISGLSLSVALLVTALFSFDSIDYMIDIVFSQTERQDATITFSADTAPNGLQAVEKLPGVMRAEAFRATPIVLTNGHLSRRLAIVGVPKQPQLSRILDTELEPTGPAPRGLLISSWVAEVLDLGVGSRARVELLAHGGQVREVPVTGIVESYVGLGVYMDIAALDRLVGDGPRISGAQVMLDDAQSRALFGSVKEIPAIASISLKKVSLAKFRETIAENITLMTSVYVVLAAIITFGVAYNSARIQFSERARELASLRVFGFTRGEVSMVLIIELGMIVLLAQPVGWLLGYGFAVMVVEGSASDLFRIPFVIHASTFAWSSLVVMIVAAFSTILVRRRVDGLDMVRVLKTRE